MKLVREQTSSGLRFSQVHDQYFYKRSLWGCCYSLCKCLYSVTCMTKCVLRCWEPELDDHQSTSFRYIHRYKYSRQVLYGFMDGSNRFSLGSPVGTIDSYMGICLGHICSRNSMEEPLSICVTEVIQQSIICYTKLTTYLANTVNRYLNAIQCLCH